MSTHEPLPLKSDSNLGWECPNCNNVYSPCVIMCPECKHKRNSTIEEVKDSRKLLLEGIEG